MILQAALTIVDRAGVDRLSSRSATNWAEIPVMLYHHVPTFPR
ncbi:MAG: hypothetical protein WAO15_25245 [Mycobacterium sp.]